MYHFRLRFFIHFPGLIQDENNYIEFCLLPNQSLLFKSLSEEPIKNANEFELTVGRFETESEAWEVGHLLKDSLLILGAKWEMGIDAGKDQVSLSLADSVKDEMRRDCQVQVIDNIHGLTVFPDDLPFTTSSMKGSAIVNQKTTQDFEAELLAIFKSNPQVSDKDRLALELYNGSHYERSTRTQFLTLVLALESLLELQKRSCDVIEVVKQLEEVVKTSTIDQTNKQSILSSLNWLRKESINQGLRRLATTYLRDKIYNNLPADKFISCCYEARSKLVHTGQIDESKIKLGDLLAELKLFVADVLIQRSVSI